LIRRTLQATQRATFSVDLPSPKKRGMPTPTGTGFFVSPDGWFLTAAHVVSIPDRVVRGDIEEAWTRKESRGEWSLGFFMYPRLDWVDHDLDVAILKLDLDRNRKRLLPGAVEFLKPNAAWQQPYFTAGNEHYLRRLYCVGK
jgi:serine protease Do